MSTKYRYTTDPGSFFDDYVVDDSFPIRWINQAHLQDHTLDALKYATPKKKDEFWDKLPACPHCHSNDVRPHHTRYDTGANFAQVASAQSRDEQVFCFKCKSCGNEWSQRRTYADGLISVLRKEVDGFKL